ncbi:hypothetical protein [Cellulosilyticum sp. I15G10I2]|uniref:hypothetical protein n=1 Tax=Cellulosilyticum sp. I15G10I2 TaxID=1892843 RepID=UPI00085BF201|nr:hypothetical protein [Cellulosilyticum sp. I15G10I2]
MRKYCALSNIPSNTLKETFTYLFNICDKVNIYFPNEASLEIMNFKDTFLKAAHIANLSNELLSTEDALEEKEGYAMIIASLTDEIKELILNINAHFSLSLGLINGDKVIFYIGDAGECIIEDAEDSDIFSSPLFNTFKTI